MVNLSLKRSAEKRVVAPHFSARMQSRLTEMFSHQAWFEVEGARVDRALPEDDRRPFWQQYIHHLGEFGFVAVGLRICQ
jgi:hypothetical protein